MTDRPRVVEGKLWRQEWMRTPAEQRARVEQAVRAGEALKDPSDAALAVGYAVQRRQTMSGAIIVAVVLIVIFVGFATREGSGSMLAGFSLLPMIGAGVAHKRRAAALRAELQNREVVYETLATMKPPPPSTPVSDPWADVPGTAKPLDDPWADIPEPSAPAEPDHPDESAP